MGTLPDLPSPQASSASCTPARWPSPPPHPTPSGLTGSQQKHPESELTEAAASTRSAPHAQQGRAPPVRVTQPDRLGQGIRGPWGQEG